MKSTRITLSDLFEFQEVVYHNENILWLKKFTKEDIRIFKTRTNLFISADEKFYYLKDTPENRQFIFTKSLAFGKEAIDKIDPINYEAFSKFQELLILKSYSQNTVRTYTNEFAQFLYVLKKHPVEKISEEKIRNYLVFCAKELELSENQIHSRINALKFYFEKVLGREKLFLGIPRPKKPQLLPKSLAPKEIKNILEVTENIKHLLMIKLCYGMGLRVSEIVALKLEHINTKDMRVLISAAKGKKDRYVYLPESILPDLKKYYNNYLPQIYLFENQENCAISVRTVQSVFKNSMRKAGIKRNVGIHCLRHSYATHLLEFGTDISHIQKLLGHNNIKTTLGYTQVIDKNLAKIVSPLDRF